MVQSALDGHGVCIFAYGQTGSGKSFTMEGPPDCKQDSSFYEENPARGVIPRAVRKIFHQMPEFAKSGWTYTLHCSFVEVYQEKIYDLLSDSRDERELSDNGDLVIVKDLMVLEVSSVEEVDELMIKAKSNRRVGATNMNEHSSRSHFLFQLLIEGTNINGTKCCGRLNLVDLAGSEKLDAAQDEKQRKEGQKIRESLGALKTVLTRLRKDANASAPSFRDSKLTHLLKNTLSAGSKVLMFVNVAPEESSFEETKSSLNFGTSVNSVKLGSANANKY
jgi:kinesin family protein C1